jgi:hypothetical protein
VDNPDELEINDALARALSREATLARPEFSAALHARLRAALRAAPVAEPSSVGGRPRSLRSGILSWAIAAAASLAVTVVLAWVCHNPRAISPAPFVQELPVDSRPLAGDDFEATAGMVSVATSGLEDWMQQTASESQWAGLDRDAETVLATVTGPLPFDLSLALAADSPE